jgi:hypothetical protein
MPAQARPAPTSKRSEQGGSASTARHVKGRLTTRALARNMAASKR